MNVDAVKVGRLYRAKVAGKVTLVRVNGVNPAGGFDAMDEATARRIRLRSARPILCECDKRGKPVEAKPAAAASAKARAKAPAKKAPAKKAAGRKAKKAPAKKAKGGRAKKAAGKKAAKLGGLDAVARVLAEEGRAMRPAEMVELAIQREYWATGGKTPGATIHSAIIREIRSKGDKARFVKTAAGVFGLSKSAKAAARAT